MEELSKVTKNFGHETWPYSYIVTSEFRNKIILLYCGNFGSEATQLAVAGSQVDLILHCFWTVMVGPLPGHKFQYTYFMCVKFDRYSHFAMFVFLRRNKIFMQIFYSMYVCAVCPQK
jgi:hypothetical protein